MHRLAALAVLPLVGCSKNEPSPGQAAAAAARDLYAQRCLACHGPDGKGAGPAAASLTPRPRDFTDPKWQAATSDADVRKVVLQGGAASGKSALMPPSPDLASNPELLASLVAKIRGFAAK